MIGAASRLVRSSDHRREVVAYARYVARNRLGGAAVRQMWRTARNPGRRGAPMGLALSEPPPGGSEDGECLPLGWRPPPAQPLAVGIPESDPETRLAAHRFGWIPPLVSAGAADDRIVAAIASAVDWSRANPPEPDRPGWDAYCVAERIANWVLLASAVRRWNVQADLTDLTEEIRQSAKFLRGCLEFRGAATNNHLLNDARGLYLAGAILGDRSCLGLGRELLRYGCAAMFTPSGFLREGSAHYHLLLCRSYLEVIAAAHACGDKTAIEELSPRVCDMAAAAGFLLESGTLPLVGDCSPDTSVEFLAGVPLAASAILGVPIRSRDPGTPGWHRMFVPPSPTQGADPSPTATVSSFPDAGFHRVRSGRAVLTIYANPLGYVPAWSHGHADLGGFVLDWGGVPLLVDCGRASYASGGPGAYGRSVLSHNAIAIEGYEPSVVHSHNGFVPPLLPCYAERPPRVRAESVGEQGVLRIEHDGFSRITPGIVVTRAFTVAGNAVRIEDHVSGMGRRTIETRFHLHPDVAVDRVSANAVEMRAGGRLLVLRCVGGDAAELEVVSGRAGDRPEGWFSPRYGELVHTTTLRFTRRSLPANATYVLEEIG